MKKRKLKKNVKIITLFLVVLATIITPFVFSKYTTTFKDKIIVHIRQPHYQVVFHSNNGSNPEVTTTQDFVYGTAENLDANPFTKTDYHFSKWTTERDGTGTSYNDEEEVNKLTSFEGATINLYAQWKEGLVVTLNANGGTIPSGSAWDGSGSTASKHINTATYGNLPTPTKSGYTFFGWKESDSVVPSEYQEVEYIESTGTQYINTGYIINSNNVEFDGTAYMSKGTSETDLIGLEGTSETAIMIGTGWNNYALYAYSSNSDGRAGLTSSSEVDSYMFNNKFNFNIKYNSSSPTKELIINNNPSSYVTDTTANSNFIGKQIQLLAAKNDYKFKGRLYGLKIYDNNVLVSNFVPVYRISDGVIGLYDTVRNTFLTNSGTGSFSKGKNVDYITSTTIVEKDEDHTLYAVWGHNPTVTFDAKGGAVSPSAKTYNYNSNYTDLPTPIKSGYTFVGWTEFDLPNSYHAVDWIESSGSQYIYTDLAVNKDDIFETKSSTNSKGDYHTIIGGASSGTFELYYNLPSVSTYSNISIITGQTTNVNLGEAYIHKTKVTSASSNLEIFSYNKNYNLNGKIYYVKWFRNGELIHYFIPCYNTLDGTIGLYDTIGNKFYKNSGTGSFNKGNDIEYITSQMQMITNEDHTLYAVWEHNPTITLDANGGIIPNTSNWINSQDNETSEKGYQANSTYGNLPIPTRNGYSFLGWKTSNSDYVLPSEYQELEYIESTGAQYINTNLSITTDLKLILDFKANSKTSQKYIMGRYQSDNGSFYLYFGSGNYFQTAYGSKYANTTKQSDTDRHYWEFYIENGNSIAKCDNNVVFTQSALATMPNSNILIGGTYHSNSAVGNNIYGAKFYSGNLLIRNFIPCYRKSDNEVGLYDLVNGVFYTNNGTGSFNKGNKVFNEYVTNNTKVVTNEDHTLYAMWEEE